MRTNYKGFLILKDRWGSFNVFLDKQEIATQLDTELEARAAVDEYLKHTREKILGAVS